MANARQFAMLWERTDEEYQELHEIIEHMNEKQGGLFGHDETKAKADEDLWEKLFQEIRVLDDRI